MRLEKSPVTLFHFLLKRMKDLVLMLR